MIFSILLSLLFIVAVIAYSDVRYAVAIAFAIMVLIPNSIKFNLGPINLNVFNLLVFIIYFFSILFIKKRKRISFQERIIIKKENRFKKIFVGYLIYVVISSFWASCFDISIGEYIKNMLLFSLEFILLGTCLVFLPMDLKTIRFFDIFLVASSVAIILYGIVNYVIQFNPYMAYVSLVADVENDMSNSFLEESRGVIHGRISSTFSHPLQLGQWAVLVFSYSLFQFRNQMNKILYYSFLFGLVLMSVLCGSRSALVPLLFVILIYMISFKRRKIVKYAIFSLMLILFSYSALPNNARQTVDGMVKVWDEKAADKAGIKGSSSSGRLDQFGSALTIIDQNILLGFGEGHIRNYGSTHPEMYGYESIFLKYLVDGGFIGLFVFVYFYYKLYKWSLKICSNKFERGRIHSLYGAFFISIVLTGISYSFFGLFTILCIYTYKEIIFTRNTIKF